MYTTDNELITCDYPGRCNQKIRNLVWDKIQAEGFGWLINRNGTALCPKHRSYWFNETEKKEE